MKTIRLRFYQLGNELRPELSHTLGSPHRRFYQLGNELRPEPHQREVADLRGFYQLGNSLHRFTSFESEWRTSQHQKTVRTP